jgi:hypothetical protein
LFNLFRALARPAIFSIFSEENRLIINQPASGGSRRAIGSICRFSAL